MLDQEQRHVLRVSLRTGLVVVAVIGALVSSCRNVTGSDEPETSGAYSLIRYDNEPLPAHYATVPPREPPGESCELMVTAGALTLSAGARSAAGGYFVYSYEVESGCDAKVVAAPQTGGTFWQDGRSLLFRVSGVDGTSSTFDGVIEGRSVRIIRDKAMVFERLSP